MDRLRALGVEEEFVLVDSETGAPAPAAAEVLTAAASLSPAQADFALHPELLRTQVEVATGRCTTLDQLAEQLVAGRRVLATAARSLGLWLVAVGSPVLGGAASVSRGARFTAIAGRYAGVIRDYQACGCHVHVEVPDREDAVAVVNQVRPWLPVLLALSVNSPFHLGADTGYASWRMVAHSRFPGAGVPPVFASAADYRDQDHVRSPLTRSGDLTAVTRWVADIMRAGTGADHQRAVISDGPHAIVRRRRTRRAPVR